VDEGLLIRRRLDEEGRLPDLRDQVVRACSRLERAALESLARALASAAPDAEAVREDVARRLDDVLRRDEAYASQILARTDLAPARAAFLCDAFHADLQWYARLQACLDGEAAPDAAYALQSRLDRLARSLLDVDPVEDWFDPEAALRNARAADLLRDCRRLRREYLDARIEDEIRHPVDDASPLSLWHRRLQLTQLEADRWMLEADASPEEPSGRRGPSFERLDRRREELADLAEARLSAMTRTQRESQLRELAVSAQEASNDVLTRSEDLPLAVGVALLQASASDFERLTRTAERADGETGDGRPAQRGPLARSARKLARRARNEWQEKTLALRLERVFGRRFVARLENAVLLLILVLSLLIFAELLLESLGRLTEGMRAAFAWTDLAVCSVFLFEFGLKLAWAPDRLRYFRRRFLVDFLASIPYGFFGYQLSSLAAGPLESANLLRLLRFLRLPQLARYARPARQLVRFGRLLVFLMRSADRLVRRHAHVLNRNIVLFEPALQDWEAPAHRVRLERLRETLRAGERERERTLSAADRIERAAASLADLRARCESLPTTALHEPAPRTAYGRDVPAEAVVRSLIETTPEQVVRTLGSEFPEALLRRLRYFDLPLVRRLPAIRSLLAARDQGAGEVAALAANQLGYALQAVLNVAYFFADLHGTISGPIFLDRLGTLLVSATARNAYRLLVIGFTVAFLYAVVRLMGVAWLEWVFGLVQPILGRPLLVLGGVCLVVMFVGRWFKSIANQTSEEGERLVEAQFAAQTKALKAAAMDEDLRFLAERVAAPELLLRSLDDPDPHSAKPMGLSAEELLRRALAAVAPARVHGAPQPRLWTLHGEELVFLRSVALLYVDYLDSGLFRPSDTKATTQLLGNLALVNFRRTSLADELSGRKLRGLDLARASSALFAGPYLWFQYMTRIVTEETAKRIVDFNRNAVPLSRLACAPAQTRAAYRNWLAKRLEIEPSNVPLPPPAGEFGDRPSAASPPPGPPNAPRFETIDFTTMDFLASDPRRDDEIEEKFGPMVLRLLQVERRRGIRRAFRSFPLHRFPPAQRSFNPFTAYLDLFSGGRVLLLPLRCAWWTLRGLAFFVRQTVRTIRDVLRPPELAPDPDDDSYAVAVRKIHRMRKPGFIASLWLRARIDVEYLGIPVPGAPLTVGGGPLLEDDLDFIGCTRRERLAAERLVLAQRQKVQSMIPTLRRLGFDLDRLQPFLDANVPHLRFRAAEAMRALVTAWILDYDGFFSLATALDGLRRLVDFASRSNGDPAHTPPGLPGPVSRPPYGYTAKPSSRRRDLRIVLRRLGRGGLDDAAARRVVRCLRRHWPLVRGWVGVLASVPPDRDPLELALAQAREIVLRTDLWSDQIVAMRAIQSLTILDVYHYCRMVWTLGGYGERDGEECPARLPAGAEPLDWSARAAAGA
jgi:hypothetical protein